MQILDRLGQPSSISNDSTYSLKKQLVEFYRVRDPSDIVRTLQLYHGSPILFNGDIKRHWKQDAYRVNKPMYFKPTDSQLTSLELPATFRGSLKFLPKTLTKLVVGVSNTDFDFSHLSLTHLEIRYWCTDYYIKLPNTLKKIKINLLRKPTPLYELNLADMDDIKTYTVNCMPNGSISCIYSNF